MDRINTFARFLYQHHFVRYLFVGGTTFILDFTTLFILHAHFGINIAIATSIAYWLSVMYNFSLNRWWTFSKAEQQSMQKHAAMYGALLGANYLFTVIFVSVVSHFIYFGLAKALAVTIQISWTYYLYKNYIFV